VRAIEAPESRKNEEKTDKVPDFVTAYREYYPVVLRHAAYLTGSVQAAEDIVQEAFAKLYKAPPAHGNTIAWLSRVTSNLAYNHIRDEKGRKGKEPVLAEDDAEKVISIEERAIRNQEVRLVRKVLSGLPARDRMCLLLKFSGYRYDEISEIIEVEKSSVGTILARAQAKFKERYVFISQEVRV
jgi:RNA polymerase sigma factor (sigma-70 family)